MPDDAAFVLANTRTCHGFYGASSMERLPAEIASPNKPAPSSRIKSG